MDGKHRVTTGGGGVRWTQRRLIALMLGVAMQCALVSEVQAQVLDTGAGKSPASEAEEELVWGPQPQKAPPPSPPDEAKRAEAAPASTEAEEPDPDASSKVRTANRFQANLGFRFALMATEGLTELWWSGAGLAAGYTFDFGLYTGASLDLYLGQSDDEKDGVFLQATGDAGYDIRINAKNVLRPKLGFGFTNYQGHDTDVKGGVLAPGVAFIYAGRRFLFAFDIRYDIALTDKSLHGGLLGFSFGV